MVQNAMKMVLWAFCFVISISLALLLRQRVKEFNIDNNRH